MRPADRACETRRSRGKQLSNTTREDRGRSESEAEEPDTRRAPPHRPTRSSRLSEAGKPVRPKSISRPSAGRWSNCHRRGRDAAQGHALAARLAQMDSDSQCNHHPSGAFRAARWPPPRPCRGRHSPTRSLSGDAPPPRQATGSCTQPRTASSVGCGAERSLHVFVGSSSAADKSLGMIYPASPAVNAHRKGREH
jgi:hypothetical protein